MANQIFPLLSSNMLKTKIPSILWDTGEIICFMVIEIESGCGTYVELTCRGAAHGIDVVVVQCFSACPIR